MPARWRGGPTEPKSGTAPPHPLPGPDRKNLLWPPLTPPRTAPLISSGPADARALARRPDRAEIWYRAATSAARSRAGCSGELASMRVGRGLEGEESIQPAPLL